ncbi:MAG: hypothetical protein L3J82_03700 [Planctomycetes bacterium]|nr:hypothetical protein [Planctomycetota bacterium]
MTENTEPNAEQIAPEKPIPFRLIAIIAGVLIGGTFAMAMPDTWLFVPQEAVAAEHDHSADDGGGKEFWA